METSDLWAAASTVGTWSRAGEAGAVKEGFLGGVSCELSLARKVGVSQGRISEKNVLGGESSIGLVAR